MHFYNHMSLVVFKHELYFRPVFFWDITQRWMVILYWHFGKTYRSHLQRPRSPKRIGFFDFLTLEEATDIVPKRRKGITIQRCAISQKNGDLIRITAGSLKSRMSCFALVGIFRRVLRIAKRYYYLRPICLSVHPHGTTRLPHNGFSWHLICEKLSEMHPENSSFIKIWQEWEVLYMKTFAYLQGWYLTVFFSKTKNISKSADKIKTSILCSVFFFRRKCRVEKYGTGGHTTDENILWCMRFACRKNGLQTHTQNMYLLLFHGKNDYAKAPQCYVIRTLLAL
jgi:hypothetical protein